MTPEILLSDKFVEFSQKISALHETKKSMSAEIKKLVEDHKLKMKKIDDEAAGLTAEFTNWQNSQNKPTQPAK